MFEYKGTENFDIGAGFREYEFYFVHNEEDFTKAIKLNPAKSPLFSFRGLAHIGMENIENAKADFIKALELNPNNNKAKECLHEIIKAQENG